MAKKKRKKLSGVALESSIRKKYQGKLNALKKMQLGSIDRIRKARQIKAQMERELAGLAEPEEEVRIEKQSTGTFVIHQRSHRLRREEEE